MRAIEILIEALQNKSNSSLNHQQQLTQSIIEKITEGRKDFIECAAKSNPEILMSIKNALQSEISSSTVGGMKNTQSDFQGKLQERSAGFSSPGNSVGHRESQLPMLQHHITTENQIKQRTSADISGLLTNKVLIPSPLYKLVVRQDDSLPSTRVSGPVSTCHWDLDHSQMRFDKSKSHLGLYQNPNSTQNDVDCPVGAPLLIDIKSPQNIPTSLQHTATENSSSADDQSEEIKSESAKFRQLEGEQKDTTTLKDQANAKDEGKICIKKTYEKIDYNEEVTAASVLVPDHLSANELKNLTPLEMSVIIDQMLDNEAEQDFAPQVRALRRQMAEALLYKRPHDVMITPAEKQYRGPQIVPSRSKNAGKTKTSIQNSSQQVFRGSQFRGISKNGGSSWQVLVMVNREKKYLGSMPNEEGAARLYDRVVIQQQGLKAKTNFSYTRDDLAQILKMRSLA
ncbi:hypothetical protein FGO68_gene3610 [Halteria grandinella]|uniref:AP2/ERF domain-containing protein n=1 Tax=Halteria grandinella TaxID=5974 RepID=A0A8J8T5X4_HALGN|nr:hypothetical protein FGO68_gene3610 [Halteria grandinella]